MGQLSNLLAMQLRAPISDDQGPWRQFVLDHLDYIAARSTTFTLTPELMNQYRYDLRRFLEQDRKRSTDMTWIVQLVNDLPNDFDFVDIKNLTIPTDELINALYGKFKTVTANMTKPNN